AQQRDQCRSGRSQHEEAPHRPRWHGVRGFARRLWQAMTDLLGGQVQVIFGAVTSSIGYIKAGRVRALAATTAKRSETLPDLPTVGDFVPGYEASQLYGLGVAKTRPPRSSTDSTRRSTWPLPTPISKRALPT